MKKINKKSALSGVRTCTLFVPSPPTYASCYMALLDRACEYIGLKCAYVFRKLWFGLHWLQRNVCIRHTESLGGSMVSEALKKFSQVGTSNTDGSEYYVINITYMGKRYKTKCVLVLSSSTTYSLFSEILNLIIVSPTSKDILYF